ncbi:PTPLA-domain-containing protein [Xylaria arbuscula]|nr:PTPLA-domain-containing protein [Xylaria arbuscula]
MPRYYILLYNILSLLAWMYLTVRVLFPYTTPKLTSTSTPASTTNSEDAVPLVTAVQSAAVLEILHAALGLVRSSPGAAAVQVGGRNLVVWTVVRRFPELSTGTGIGFGPLALRTCLLAWGCSDILRYALFASVAVFGSAPGWLRWLRYTAFIVLYPVGFLSEASLVYLALVKGSGIGAFYRGYLFVGLLAYIPASYFLYTYMFAQRRRALGGTERVKKA